MDRRVRYPLRWINNGNAGSKTKSNDNIVARRVPYLSVRSSCSGPISVFRSRRCSLLPRVSSPAPRRVPPVTNMYTHASTLRAIMITSSQAGRDCYAFASHYSTAAAGYSTRSTGVGTCCTLFPDVCPIAMHATTERNSNHLSAFSTVRTRSFFIFKGRLNAQQCVFYFWYTFERLQDLSAIQPRGTCQKSRSALLRVSVKICASGWLNTIVLPYTTLKLASCVHARYKNNTHVNV